MNRDFPSGGRPPRSVGWFSPPRDGGLPMETTLRLLLMLSQKLASARREVALGEALPLILAATGSAFGAAYLKQSDALVLAAQSGMPAQLRCLVERLGFVAPSCFIAQRAADS